MQVWPDFFPMWSSYDSSTDPAIIRSSLSGRVQQRRVSHRNVNDVEVSLQVYGWQIKAVEHFIRDLCNEGLAPFSGRYRSSSGIVTGVLRIVSGDYRVQFTTSKIQTITATIEVLS